MDLEINKGIGRNVEFKGLESQYLFIFCGGLLAVFYTALSRMMTKVQANSSPVERVIFAR